MKYEVKEAAANNEDFRDLCKRLDDFQNEIIPERVNLGMSALQGLEKLEVIYLMYDGKKAIACGGLKRVNDDTAELARMYTDDDYRGQGLAKVICDKVMTYAKSAGYKRIILDTWVKSKSARRLYESMGFKEREAFDANTFKNSFSTYDDEIQKRIEDKLVFMEREL